MKPLQHIVFLAVTIALFSFTSCINCVEPQGEVTTKNIKLDNFSKIIITIPANIKIVTGDSAKISISSYESYLAAITTTVRRGKTKFRMVIYVMPIMMR